MHIVSQKKKEVYIRDLIDACDKLIQSYSVTDVLLHCVVKLGSVGRALESKLNDEKKIAKFSNASKQTV